MGDSWLCGAPTAVLLFSSAGLSFTCTGLLLAPRLCVAYPPLCHYNLLCDGNERREGTNKIVTEKNKRQRKERGCNYRIPTRDGRYYTKRSCEGEIAVLAHMRGDTRSAQGDCDKTL